MDDAFTATLTAPNAVSDPDLQMILAAWNTATERLQQTHELLRGEVKRLTDELEAKNHELARQTRLADLGQMASHVAHEVRNGLVPLKLYLNLLQRRVVSDTDSLTISHKIGAGFTALETVVSDLLQFTSHREPQLQEIAVGQMAADLCESLRPQLNAQAIVAKIDVSANERCWADPDMLRRALLNLVLNAIDAMPNGGELLVCGSEQDDHFALAVCDSGPGFATGIAERLFEPFFTTKGSGTGLGLAIVDRICEVHGGSIVAENRPTGGASFTLRLPHFNTSQLPLPRMVA